MPSWSVHFNVTVRTAAPSLIRAMERSRALAETLRGIPGQHRCARTALRAQCGSRPCMARPRWKVHAFPKPKHWRCCTLLRTGGCCRPTAHTDEREARNAQAALQFVQRTARSDPGRPLDEMLIREIHRLTTDGLAYARNVPGEYRNHAVTVGDYRPPPTSEEVRRHMAEFLRWFNQGEALRWDPIVRAALAHFYVVSIHPFGDGNGRTSRAVESFMLCRAGIHAFGFYSLANYYYRHRGEYIRALSAARFRSDGDLTDFVLFAAQGLASELAAVRDELLAMVRVLAFRDYARERLEAVPGLGERRRSRMLEVVRRITEPSLRGVPDQELAPDVLVAMTYGRVGQRTIQRDLRLLLDQGLLTERDGRLVPNVDVMSEFAEA